MSCAYRGRMLDEKRYKTSSIGCAFGTPLASFRFTEPAPDSSAKFSISKCGVLEGLNISPIALLGPNPRELRSKLLGREINFLAGRK